MWGWEGPRPSLNAVEERDPLPLPTELLWLTIIISMITVVMNKNSATGTVRLVNEGSDHFLQQLSRSSWR
jgi:hypothetical protein